MKVNRLDFYETLLDLTCFYILLLFSCIIAILILVVIIVLSNNIARRLEEYTDSKTPLIVEDIKPTNEPKEKDDSLTLPVKKQEKPLALYNSKYLTTRLEDGTELKLMIVKDSLLL
jgi:hypothetical protein